MAVLAGGVDQLYPAENDKLYNELKARGVLVSEMPLGVQPTARYFPRRNRIIAGLAKMTVVIEASPMSGSLITAKWAADFGREVGAVPGSPFDGKRNGGNRLIRDGAIMVESVDDILDAVTSATMTIGEPSYTQDTARLAPGRGGG